MKLWIAIESRASLWNREVSITAVPIHSKTTTWMGSSRMHPYPPERQLCGFMAEFLDGSSRKGSGWSQHVKQNPKIVIVCHFKSTLRFAPFCGPALNKVTRMLNLSSSLFSKFLFSSHWYLSLSSSFFVSFLASRGLGLTLHSILSVWCSLSGLV